MKNQHIIREFIKSVLVEVTPDPAEKFAKGSFDAQVDGRLLNLEREAKQAYKELNVESVIREADEDTDEPEGGGNDDKAPPAAEKAAEEPDQSLKEKIDVDTFTTGVLELIENFMNLIEIKNTVARRAIHLLKQMHDDEIVQQFKEALHEHGLDIGKSKEEYDLDAFQAPPAAGAGPGGGGGVA